MRQSRAQKEAALRAAAEETIQRFLDWEEQAAKPDLTEIEDAVLKLRQGLSQRMAEVALSDQEATQPAAGVRCPECGEPMHNKGQKALDVESRLGTLAVARGYYYCARCQSGLFPPGRAA
jgi:uncharacterized protein with PIN domain